MPPPTAARTTRRSATASRARILAAACTEFAARGFDGTTVDRIAATARLNKAMIYYHFPSKRALYRDLLTSMFTDLVARVDPLVTAALTPLEKLDAFVERIVEAGQAHPNLPPIVVREMTDGGRHVDTATIKPMVRLLEVMTAIVAEGIAKGDFRKVDPLLVYLTTIWPVMFFLISKPMRTKVSSVSQVDPARLTPESFIRHMQSLNRRAVAPDVAEPQRSIPLATSERAS
jgi:TetR/AcrR family transcriptional regulator